jgi:hypothetical protein
MPSHTVEPQLGAESFSCPHCNALAHQDWFSLFLKADSDVSDVVVITPEAAMSMVERFDDEDDRKRGEQFVERLKNNDITYQYQKYSQNLKVKMVNLHLSTCYSCNEFAVWVQDRLVFPTTVEEIPTLRQEDFEEAAAVLDRSPRGVVALIHLCVHKLMPLLAESGKIVDEEIASLARKGLRVEIQEEMDLLRRIGDNAVHPGEIDLKGDKATETKLFESLKQIVERRMLKKQPQSE